MCLLLSLVHTLSISLVAALSMDAGKFCGAVLLPSSIVRGS